MSIADYSHWVKRQLKPEISIKEIEKYVIFFDLHKELFKVKEIEKYTFNLLKEEVDKLDNDRINKHVKGLSEDDYAVVHHDNDYIIFRANTRKAAKQLGKGTKWCINSKFDQHFQEDSVKGFVFYILIRKFRKNNELDKIAVTINNSDVIYYDQKDKNINSTLYLDIIDNDYSKLDYKNVNVYLDCYYNYKKYLDSNNLFLKYSALKRLNENEIIKYINDPSDSVRLIVAKKISKNKLHLLINDPSEKVRAYICNIIPKKYLFNFINDSCDTVRIDIADRIPKKYLPQMIKDKNNTVMYNLSKRIDKKYFDELAQHTYEFVRLLIVKRMPQTKLSVFYNDTSDVVAFELSKRLNDKQKVEAKKIGSLNVKYYIDLWESETYD